MSNGAPLKESTVQMFHGGATDDHFPTLGRGTQPGSPASCQGRHRESCRFEWSVGDGGDPAELVSAFLSGNGLSVRDIGRTATQIHPTGAETPCGAALYVSASAGSVMIGGSVGPPSPVPGIPDVVAVVHVHIEPTESSPSVKGACAIGPGNSLGYAAGARPDRRVPPRSEQSHQDRGFSTEIREVPSGSR